MLTQDPCKLELGGCWVTMQWWAGLKLPQTQAIRKAWRTVGTEDCSVVTETVSSLGGAWNSVEILDQI